jgi:2-iminobutanoate/2-iminopropanoate deaminase
VGIVPGTLTLVPGGLEPEARQTMDNIRTTLSAHGYTMNDLVRCLVMLTDMSEWSKFNEIYKTYFTGRFPARSAIGASGLALGARVEVECTAARDTAP